MRRAPFIQTFPAYVTPGQARDFRRTIESGIHSKLSKSSAFGSRLPPPLSCTNGTSLLIDVQGLLDSWIRVQLDVIPERRSFPANVSKTFIMFMLNLVKSYGSYLNFKNIFLIPGNPERTEHLRDEAYSQTLGILKVPVLLIGAQWVDHSVYHRRVDVMYTMKNRIVDEQHQNCLMVSPLEEAEPWLRHSSDPQVPDILLYDSKMRVIVTAKDLPLKHGIPSSSDVKKFLMFQNSRQVSKRALEFVKAGIEPTEFSVGRDIMEMFSPKFLPDVNATRWGTESVSTFITPSLAENLKEVSKNQIQIFPHQMHILFDQESKSRPIVMSEENLPQPSELGTSLE
eukprot:PhF_6_TR13590/c0_g1_i1/m.21739